MPTLSAFYGILIQMFWQAHPPPHFHALYGEFEALIDIRTFAVIRGRCHAEHLRSCGNGLPYTTMN